MSGFLAVFKKEVRTYLYSPAAYVFVGLLLALVGFFYTVTVELYAEQYLLSQQNPFAGGPSDINEFLRLALFQYMVTFFLFLIPLLTMRLIAAEKNARTDELLFTSPVSVASIVLGKFAAAMLVVLFALSLTLYVPYFAGEIAAVDAGPLIASYLAIIGLAGCFIAVGLLASALTDQQIIAAVVSFVALLILMILPMMAGTMENAPLRAVFEYIAYQEHFERLSKGLIELRDVVYVLSFMGTFLFLAHEYLIVGQTRSQSAENAPGSRWIMVPAGVLCIIGFFAARSVYPPTELDPNNWQKGLWIAGSMLIAGYFALEWERIASSFKTRSFVFASLASVQVIVVLGMVGGANWLAERRNVKWDITDVGLYTLAPQSIQIAKSFNEPVDIAVFMRDTEPTRNSLKDLLALYESESELLKVRFIDPEKNPVEARQYSLGEKNTIYFSRGEGESRQRTNITTQSEEDITAALIKLGRAERRSVCFLSGHGERDVMSEEVTGFASARGAVEGQGYETKALDSLSEESLKACSVLIIAGPESEPFEGELAAIDGYLKAGGQVFVMIDPTPAAGLEKWLAGYGIEVQNDVVIDIAGAVMGMSYFTTVVGPPFDAHQIVRELPGRLNFPAARTLKLAEEMPDGVSAEVLVNSREDVWGEVDLKDDTEGRPEFTEDHDHAGPLPLAVAATLAAEGEGKEGRMVVVGDSDFANNRFFYVGGFNSDFFLNAVAWLSDDGDLVSIRPRKRDMGTINLPSDAMHSALIWVSWFLVPGGLLGLGILIWRRRRSA